jgi:serine/threonine-protein kinase
VLLLLMAGGGGGYYYYAMLTPVAPPPPPMPRLPGPGDGDKSAAVRPTAPPPAVRVPPAAPSPPPSRPPDTASQGAPPAPVNTPIAAPTPGPAPGGPARIEKIRRYVEEYDGGECFFVAPVAVGESAAALEGFGASTRGFEVLDKAFAREHGFEASIGLRQVTQPQCPAITFLARLRSERARAPRLQIASTSVRSGDVLNGTIENYGVRHVELLLVSDGGLVQNVSYALKDGTDAKTFSLGMQRTEGAGGQPQLLLAVASPRLLEALRPSRPVPADQFFLLVQSEAARAGLTLSATARYFKLER